jgi:protein-disulfide isomerase
MLGGQRAGAEVPVPPQPIAKLGQDGAKLTYLGNDLGYDAWIAIKDGQEQYFYVAPGGKIIFLGIMFSEDGRAVTFDQLKRLANAQVPIKDAPQVQENAPTVSPSSVAQQKLSKSERLWQDVTTAHAISWGASVTAPTLYLVADPLCPHCKDLMKMFAPLVEVGTLKVNIILVGVAHEDSPALAAGILGSSDPLRSLLDLMNGKALPPKGDAADPRLAQNLTILTKWGFAGTPVTVYRAKDGVIKLLEGVPKSTSSILEDLR